MRASGPRVMNRMISRAPLLDQLPVATSCRMTSASPTPAASIPRTSDSFRALTVSPSSVECDSGLFFPSARGRQTGRGPLVRVSLSPLALPPDDEGRRGKRNGRLGGGRFWGSAGLVGATKLYGSASVSLPQLGHLGERIGIRLRCRGRGVARLGELDVRRVSSPPCGFYLVRAGSVQRGLEWGLKRPAPPRLSLHLFHT